MGQNTSEKEKAEREKGEGDERRENRTMGRKHIVPYGLYRAHGFVSAKLAERTGFSQTRFPLGSSGEHVRARPLRGARRDVSTQADRL